MKISVHGNKSKGIILGVTEQFRCQCLVRYQWFASGRFRCFLIKLRLCGQIGCSGERKENRIINIRKYTRDVD